jgi:hypothetical protein
MLLGKKHDVHRPSDLRLRAYLDLARISTSEAPAAPNWESVLCLNGELPKKDRDDLGNANQRGNCVLATPAHMVNLIRQLKGILIPPVTAAECVAVYDELTGGIDEGFVIRDMLQIWHDRGLYGTKLLAAAMVDRCSSEEVSLATWLGGGLIGGYSLPANWQEQITRDRYWSVPRGGWEHGQGPDSKRGHCTFSLGTSPGGDTVNTWGEVIGQTWEWRQATCSELWLVLTDLWVEGGEAPNGFAREDLISDFRARGGILI